MGGEKLALAVAFVPRVVSRHCVCHNHERAASKALSLALIYLPPWSRESTCFSNFPPSRMTPITLELRKSADSPTHLMYSRSNVVAKQT